MSLYHEVDVTFLNSLICYMMRIFDTDAYYMCLSAQQILKLYVKGNMLGNKSV